MGMIGKLSPTMWAISLPHWPPALTTISVRIVPWSVTTSSTPPFLSPMRLTVVSVKKRAPPFLAPAASAFVSPVGSMLPSVGV